MSLRTKWISGLVHLGIPCLSVVGCGPSDEVRQAREAALAASSEAKLARAEAALALSEARTAKAEAAAARADAAAAKAQASVKQAPVCSLAPHVPKAGAPRISLSSKGVEINGHLLPTKPRLADLRAALGTASRVDKAANDIHVYDDLGVIAYQKPGTDQITQISAFFSREELTFMPRTLFQGTLTVDGAPVDVLRTVAAEKPLAKGIKLWSDKNPQGCLGMVGAGFDED